MKKYLTAPDVAWLYEVNRSTIHRWIEAGQFDPAPTFVSTPSGSRDRPLFEAASVQAQFEKEIAWLKKADEKEYDRLRARLNQTLKGS